MGGWGYLLGGREFWCVLARLGRVPWARPWSTKNEPSCDAGGDRPNEGGGAEEGKDLDGRRRFTIKGNKHSSLPVPGWGGDAADRGFLI